MRNQFCLSEQQQIIPAAGFGIRSAHIESAERMNTDQCTGNLPVNIEIPGVEFILGDFRDDAVLLELTRALDGRKVDLVLSDMAPNMSGIQMTDQARVMDLAELTLAFAAQHLRAGGDMLVKVFQGAGYMELREAMRKIFEVILIRKPSASRGRSAETFVLARKKRAQSVQ